MAVIVYCVTSENDNNCVLQVQEEEMAELYDNDCVLYDNDCVLQVKEEAQRKFKMDLASMFSQIAQITDHLFLSSAAAVRGDKVRSLGITNIINITLDIPNLQLPNVECIQIHVDDTPSAHLAVYFDRCADKINQVQRSGGRTLVHCVAGVSRSASICLAYLMKYHNMPLDEAYRYVKRRRSIIHPNVGFFRQLIDYEKRLFGRNTVKMVQSSVGPIPDIYKKETENMVWLPGNRSHHYGY